MKSYYALLFLICFTSPLALASDQDPEFDYGFGETHFKWGTELPKIESEKSDFKLRLGTRLQAIAENKSVKESTDTSNTQDFYVRRARLQVNAQFQKDISFYMDIRADKVDKGVKSENVFGIGDAFLQVKNVFSNKNLKLRLFRAKFDVSRTQTVSSSRLIIPNRASISDFAADYISYARRGTNIQLLGNWNKQIQTQLVVGDSVNQNGFKDALGNKGVTLTSQNMAAGARIRVSPFASWKDAGFTETFFGKGKHFTLGAGHFVTQNINFTTTAVPTGVEVDRSLSNFDLSFHYGSFSFLSEFFILDGMIDDFASATTTIGKSDGGFAQAEYVFTNFHYIAPFLRYQTWNRFKDFDNFSENTMLAGINYYMKGNKLKTGLYYETVDYDDALATAAGFGETDTTIGVHLMMHY